MTQLTYLDASFNKIEDISPDIGKCFQLTDLTLSSNNLQELPDSLGNLHQLLVLRLDENELKTIPSTLGRYVDCVCVCRFLLIMFFSLALAKLKRLQSTRI